MLEARFGSGSVPPECVPRTSLRLEAGSPRHEQAHRERLRAGLLALGASPVWLDPALDRAVEWARMEAHGAPLLALRWVADPETETVYARLEAMPALIQPYTLVPMRHPISSDAERFLAPHKGCLGPWNVETLAMAQTRGAQDALLHRGDLTVVETAIAAVARLEGRRLFLPPPEGRVRSIAELWDLPTWADERGWELISAPLTLQEARQGQLCCFNALRGLWPAECLPI